MEWSEIIRPSLLFIEQLQYTRHCFKHSAGINPTDPTEQVSVLGAMLMPILQMTKQRPRGLQKGSVHEAQRIARTRNDQVHGGVEDSSM